MNSLVLEREVKLPRLAFVSDVPVEQTAAGALITYRLLSGYDADRLLIVNGNFTPHDPGKRLPGVAWQSIDYFPTRLYQTRLNRWLGPILTHWVRIHAWKLASQLKEWRAEAVLTIPQLYLWVAAATAARWLKLPLHLILHDDWPSVTPAPRFASSLYHQMFGRFYRSAASRLCVSQDMADYYQEQYRAGGTVLYPTRGTESAEPMLRLRQRKNGEKLVVAYAGSLWGEGYLEMLQTMAMVLAERGGRLDIYNDATQEQLVAKGLNAPNVRACGFPPLAETADRIGATADVLFSPLPFRAAKGMNTRINFPSKLAEYTAFGLPVLVWGPAEHSAVRWAKEFDGAAALVTEQEPQALRAALDRLDADEHLRRTLATKALAAGNRCFSLEQGQEILYAALNAKAISRSAA